MTNNRMGEYCEIPIGLPLSPGRQLEGLDSIIGETHKWWNSTVPASPPQYLFARTCPVLTVSSITITHKLKFCVLFKLVQPLLVVLDKLDHLSSVLAQHVAGRNVDSVELHELLEKHLLEVLVLVLHLFLV